MTNPIAPPTIDPMAPAPLPTDTPAEFDSKAFARLQSEDTLVTQVNAAIAATYTNAVSAHESAGTAGDAADVAVAAKDTAVTQAGIATSKATEANASATSAGNSYQNFDKRYLGDKSSDPATDNQGGALQTGALYYNTVSDQMRVYSGAAWEAAYLPASAYVSGPPSAQDGHIALFDGITGGVIKDGGAPSPALVGLGNVDNTSDADKPVSAAQQAALDERQPITLAAGSTSGTPTIADNGMHLVRSAAFTMPAASVFPAGGSYAITNTSASAITLTSGSGMTMRLVDGSSKASASLAAYGTAVVLYTSASDCVIGGGVS